MKLILLASLTLAIAACGETTSTSNPVITAKDFTYDTTSLTMSPNTSVTVSLKNNGSVQHSFTIDSLSVETIAQPGSSNSATFTTPASGTLSYHCKFHPTTMMGTITISGSGGGATSTPTPTAATTTPTPVPPTKAAVPVPTATPLGGGSVYSY